MVSIELIYASIIGVLGLLVGSFLNVVIARVPHGQSIVRPPSHCPKCGHQIRWYENVPVFSWLLLRGKCSQCKNPISIRYPLVELLTCLLFLACLRQLGWGWALVSGLTFLTLLIPLVFIDLEHWILPDELTLPGMVLGVLLHIPFGWPAVKSALIGVAAGFLAFRLLEFLGWLALRKETLGSGDKYLLAMIGAFLGWEPIFGVIALSSLQGSIVGLVMLRLTGRAGPAVREDEENDPPAHSATAPASEAQLSGEKDQALPTAQDPKPASEAQLAEAPPAPSPGEKNQAQLAEQAPTPASEAQPAAVPPAPSPGEKPQTQPAERAPTPASEAQPAAVPPAPSPGEKNQAQPAEQAPTPASEAQPAVPPAPSPNEKDQAQPDEEDGEEEEAPMPFTPESFKPGLPLWRRFALLPYTLLFQPIPDEPEAIEGEEPPEWTPGATNLPYGPWIGVAALEVLLLRPWLITADLPHTFSYSLSLLFGL